MVFLGGICDRSQEGSETHRKYEYTFKDPNNPIEKRMVFLALKIWGLHLLKKKVGGFECI